MDFNQIIDAEENDFLFSGYISSTNDDSNASEFLNYVRNGFSSINLSSAEKLNSWIENEAQEFIESIPENYHSLQYSISSANDKLKIDLDDFNGDAYKVPIKKPDFLNKKQDG